VDVQPPWTIAAPLRDRLPARVASVAFFRSSAPTGASIEPAGPLPDARDLRVVAVERARQPAAFAAWLSAPSLERAAHALGPAAAAALRQAGGAVAFELVRQDPRDLEHLRLQWLVRGALEAAGAIAHLDLVTGGFLPPGLAPSGFDPALEVAILTRGEPVPEAGLPAWTRGHEKLGQPDLLTFAASPADVGFQRALLRAVTRAATAGPRLVEGATFNDGHGARFRAVTLDPTRYSRLPDIADPTLLLRRVDPLPTA
jgi:hypothetical protein